MRSVERKIFIVTTLLVFLAGCYPSNLPNEISKESIDKIFYEAYGTKAYKVDKQMMSSFFVKMLFRYYNDKNFIKRSPTSLGSITLQKGTITRQFNSRYLLAAIGTKNLKNGKNIRLCRHWHLCWLRIFLEWKMEKNLTKFEFISLYLNYASFGIRINGLRYAAKKRFNKKPTELSKTESAILVAKSIRPALKWNSPGIRSKAAYILRRFSYK